MEVLPVVSQPLELLVYDGGTMGHRLKENLTGNIYIQEK